MGRGYYNSGLDYQYDVPPVGSEIIVINRSMRSDGSFEYSAKSTRRYDERPMIMKVIGYTNEDESRLLDRNNYVVMQSLRGVKDRHLACDFAAGFKVYIIRGGGGR